jgi:hypothetical protein
VEALLGCFELSQQGWPNTSDFCEEVVGILRKEIRIENL